MASAAQAEEKITIVVKTLAGDLFELSNFDPIGERGKTPEDKIKSALRRHYLEEFPYSTSITIRSPEGPVGEIHDGDMFMAYMESKEDKPVVHLLECRPDADGVTYKFGLDKKDGVVLRSMLTHDRARHYSTNDMKEYVANPSKPDFTLFVSYKPEAERNFLAPIYDPWLPPPHPHWRHMHAFSIGENQTMEEFFKKESFHFTYERKEAEDRNVSYVEFRLKAVAARQIIRLLNSYGGRCPSGLANAAANAKANAAVASLASLSLNDEKKQEGGKRRSKRSDYKKHISKKKKKTQKRTHRSSGHKRGMK